MADMNDAAAQQGAHLDIPEQLEYSEDHVWVDASQNPAIIGITDYAANQLGDMVFVDLPEVDRHVNAGDEITELESAKAVEPLISPVSGTIVYVNQSVGDDPEVINNDPYGEGWIAKIALDDDQPELLSAEQYGNIIQ